MLYVVLMFNENNCGSDQKVNLAKQYCYQRQESLIDHALLYIYQFQMLLFSQKK